MSGKGETDGSGPGVVRRPGGRQWVKPLVRAGRHARPVAGSIPAHPRREVVTVTTHNTPAEVTAHLGDVTKATPVAVDTAIVELTNMAGWPTAVLESDSEAVTDADREAANKLLTEIRQAVAPLHAEYRRRLWQRWWWVQGGHLHRTDGPTPGNPGMGACTTLWPTTDVRWAPKVAGFDDQGAVEKYGVRVCTTCVPAAPTLDGYFGPGSLEREEAEARGRCLNKVATFDKDDNRRWAKYAKCAQCKAYAVAVTRNGHLREHENATWRDDQDRLARLDPDSKLIGTPTGDELRVKSGGSGFTQVVKTVVTARNMYVAALVNAAWSRWYVAKDVADGTDYYSVDSIVEHEAEARVLAEALAAKARMTVDAFVESMAPKVAKKIRTEIER